MAVAKARMSEQEFIRLPDDGRKYELVNGEPRTVPTGVEHDAIGANLVLLLGPYVKGRGYMTISGAGFRMSNGNIRCPDVSFTRKDRLPDGRPPKGFGGAAPDLAVEIISPSENAADSDAKVQEYFESGARQVWHLLPETNRVVVYTSPSDIRAYGMEDEIDGGDLLPGFRCRVAELFDIE